jgi:predicted phosphodiesterase
MIIKGDAVTLRIQLLSDLHFEFERDGGEAFAKDVPVAGDVLVLAGDMIPLRERNAVRSAFSWFCDRFKHVIFVPGNHEYYKTNPVDAEALLVACAREIPNLHVLNPGIILIEGIRFIGAALWFPRTPDEILYRSILNDFCMIEGFVPWVHDTHTVHLKFLKTRVQAGDIVVTHHLPHPRSIAPQHAGSPWNRFFLAKDAARLVERSDARLWIHGHTHTPCDYTISKTQVACNPRGYPHETNSFHPGFVIDV